jgi:hypothetical protein
MTQLKFPKIFAYPIPSAQEIEKPNRITKPEWSVPAKMTGQTGYEVQ